MKPSTTRDGRNVIESLLSVSDRVENAARGNAFVAIDGLSELYGGEDQIVRFDIGSYI